jgi:uncharacterized protein (TIGR02271 family)
MKSMEKNEDINIGSISEQNEKLNQQGQIIIPVIEEQLIIEKEVIESGKIRIIKQVNNEEVISDVTLVKDDIEIERVSKNEFISAIPDIHYEGETMVIPVVKEVAVVEKRLMLVEQIRVTKRKTESVEQLHNVVRKENVTIENIKNENIDLTN